MKSIYLACATLAALAIGTTTASAGNACVTKYAKATSPTESQAKWFALETTVQAVSWGLWPGYVATSKVEGYKVADKYKCAPDGGQVTCHVAATFCKGK
ncbi:MAG: hypothetical protein ABL901_20470 [Hyphomicrobiaceae bacterium]